MYRLSVCEVVCRMWNCQFEESVFPPSHDEYMSDSERSGSVGSSRPCSRLR